MYVTWRFWNDFPGKQYRRTCFWQHWLFLKEVFQHMHRGIYCNGHALHAFQRVSRCCLGYGTFRCNFIWQALFLCIPNQLSTLVDKKPSVRLDPFHSRHAVWCICWKVETECQRNMCCGMSERMWSKSICVHPSGLSGLLLSLSLNLSRRHPLSPLFSPLRNEMDTLRACFFQWHAHTLSHTNTHKHTRARTAISKNTSAISCLILTEPISFWGKLWD